ncbi:MAG: L-aspartate oxidase [Brevinematia bacterium]
MSEFIETDVLIIGLGISGGTCAYKLAEKGLNVVIILKKDLEDDGNTHYAQGGIVYFGKNDSKERIYNDIISAGAGINNPEAVKVVAEEGPKLVKEFLIDTLGVEFVRDDKGTLEFTEEGAHSIRRIIFSGDKTGKAIISKLIENLKKFKNITILDHHIAIDLITWQFHSKDKFRMYKDKTCLGAYVFDEKSKKVKTILAKATVLATGGMGRIYLHTTNPEIATGDGYAMAYRAGAEIINMEYTQFHPTTLYHPLKKNFLISESVRGEGGIIVNSKGERFLFKYDPRGELAPRDILTRGIIEELNQSKEECVFLDASKIGPQEKLKKRFPTIFSTLENLGIDMSKELIPIVPAFHFQCGGVKTDTFGKTNIKRLLAIGEVACTGLHGANRLASTSLLEGVVFGYRAAEFLIQNIEKELFKEFPEIIPWIDTGQETPDPILIKQDWDYIKNIMWNYVGPIRTRKRLKRALIDIKNLQNDIEDFYREVKVNKDIIELRNGVQTGYIVALSAWANRESIGSHYRID